MRYKEPVEVVRSLVGIGRSREPVARIAKTRVLERKLQLLTQENANLERHLAAMVQTNRVLQSMRSKKVSFKF